jgi:hypothetical protein
MGDGISSGYGFGTSTGLLLFFWEGKFVDDPFSANKIRSVGDNNSFDVVVVVVSKTSSLEEVLSCSGDDRNNVIDDVDDDDNEEEPPSPFFGFDKRSVSRDSKTAGRFFSRVRLSFVLLVLFRLKKQTCRVEKEEEDGRNASALSGTNNSNINSNKANHRKRLAGYDDGIFRNECMLRSSRRCCLIPNYSSSYIFTYTDV